MDKLNIKAESLPERCGICHRSDFFDAKANYCSRCSALDNQSLIQKNNSKASSSQQYWAYGLCYGLILFLFGFFLSGAGHGTYLLIGISSAPLGLLCIPFGQLGIPVAIFGRFILWYFVGWLLSKSGHLLYKILFLAITVSHYISIPIILSIEPFGEWEYLYRIWGISIMPIFIIGGILAYLIGQIIMWYIFFHSAIKTNRA